ncbi:MAG: hypothetical protein HPY61_12135 [Methanotrichaceae archaeon]|nr:hypothetical protein [Methanotrichaceae archaeon]
MSSAEILLRKKVEGVVGVTGDDGGWIAEVEVLEKKIVPDTQDIIGRYEMKFDNSGELLGYKRIVLRRRSDLECVEEEV